MSIISRVPPLLRPLHYILKLFMDQETEYLPNETLPGLSPTQPHSVEFTYNSMFSSPQHLQNYWVESISIYQAKEGVGHELLVANLKPFNPHSKEDASGFHIAVERTSDIIEALNTLSKGKPDADAVQKAVLGEEPKPPPPLELAVPHISTSTSSIPISIPTRTPAPTPLAAMKTRKARQWYLSSSGSKATTSEPSPDSLSGRAKRSDFHQYIKRVTEASAQKEKQPMKRGLSNGLLIKKKYLEPYPSIDQIKILPINPMDTPPRITSINPSQNKLATFELEARTITLQQLIAVLWAVSACGGKYSLLERQCWWYTRTTALLIWAINSGVVPKDSSEFRGVIKTVFDRIPIAAEVRSVVAAVLTILKLPLGAFQLNPNQIAEDVVSIWPEYKRLDAALLDSVKELNKRAVDAEAQAAAANAQAAAANARAEDAETQAAVTKARAEDAETQAAVAKARAENAEVRLEEERAARFRDAQEIEGLRAALAQANAGQQHSATA